jgi:hypothetical protein
MCEIPYEPEVRVNSQNSASVVIGRQYSILVYT